MDMQKRQRKEKENENEGKRILRVGIACHVHEEPNGSITFFAAHVTLEDVITTVVAHVYCIENRILEEDITIFALEHGGCGGSG